MYNSRPRLYYPQNYYLGRFLVAFIRTVVRDRANGQTKDPDKRKPTRRSVILTLILCFVVLPSLPMCYALFRNYQWEMNQPPTTVVPDLVGLDLKTAGERARSDHLSTQVLGQTWYTDLLPGHITLQSPSAGQRVPFETAIGLELAITPPDVLAPKRSGNNQPDQ